MVCRSPPVDPLGNGDFLALTRLSFALASQLGHLIGPPLALLGDAVP